MLKLLITFDSTTPTPLKISYKTPHTLGRDRVAGAVGAYFSRHNELSATCGESKSGGESPQTKNYTLTEKSSVRSEFQTDEKSSFNIKSPIGENLSTELNRSINCESSLFDKTLYGSTSLSNNTSFGNKSLENKNSASNNSTCQSVKKEKILIFDFGTAITIDTVSSRGEFLGGNISPGMRLRFESLNEKTGKLPLCSADNIDELSTVAQSTKQAIESGVMNSILYEIEGYMKRNEGAKIFFTGGDAKYFVKRIEKPIFADYELVIKGLNIILQYNAAQQF